jgi:copper chaperone
MVNKKFFVEGMSCGHCVATIKKAVGGLAGILNVDIILDNKEVNIEFDDSKVELGVISSKIKEAGFDVID